MADPTSTETDDDGRPDTSMLYVTCGSVNEARQIARTLVGERIVACANIIERMQSIYWWRATSRKTTKRS